MQLFQQEMSYAREDIRMNLWGSFSDSSEADGCIFIQTFCFSLLIICRLEAAMKAVSYKVVCASATFFIHPPPVIFSESRSSSNLAGHKSLKSWKCFPKGKIFPSENQMKEMWGTSRIGQWLKESIRPM